MKKDLRMERFASNKKVSTTNLYKYELHSQKIGNRFSIIKGAVKNIKKRNNCGVFTDDEYIYTTQKIDENMSNVDFTVKYIEEVQLNVIDNKKIYAQLIKYFIKSNLRKVVLMEKYKKYSCKDNVTSKWIITEKGFEIVNSLNKEMFLERKYDFDIEILDDGKAYLKINTSSVYNSNLTVYDYINKGINPVGMEVKNDWSEDTQSGILTEICNFTVIDKLDFADNLKAYYININQGWRVNKLPDNTSVVNMKFSNGKTYPYYPQALKPILKREKVKEIDADFSLRTEKYIKCNMKTRLQIDQDFIKDIGVLEQLDNLEFEIEPCPVEVMGYKKGNILMEGSGLKLPKLICASNKEIGLNQKLKVFNYGFYKKPKDKIKIGYIYPEGTSDLVKPVANAIYQFAAEGKFHNNKDKYTKENLIDIQNLAKVEYQKVEYKLDDIIDYKRAANELKDIDIVVGLIPDNEDDNEGPYSDFKKIWANEKIPSQLFSIKTAKLFANESLSSNTSKYYLHNIILGILGKTGGIPWCIADMPGNVDCFIGLDVGTTEKGIHYPACSVVLDKNGNLLGFYKPQNAQVGEKITTKILQEIFDQVILSYEEKFKESPKNIMIHRDGFSNEDDKWYNDYFNSKGILFNIVEVKKNQDSKLIFIKDNEIENPPMGYCIYNDKKAYLVTTDINNKTGSPNPLFIEKKYGNMSMKNILIQILYLCHLHMSIKSLRLPVTTGYADKICKNKDYVPAGKMNDKLFFL